MIWLFPGSAYEMDSTVVKAKSEWNGGTADNRTTYLTGHPNAASRRVGWKEGRVVSEHTMGKQTRRHGECSGGLGQ